MKTIVLFVALLAGSFSLFSQASTGPGSIAGMVIDSASGSPAEYSTIAAYSAIDSALVSGTIANSEGFFIIKDLPLGLYFLKIDFIGYQQKVISGISLTKESKSAILKKTFLIQDFAQLEAIEVVGEKSYIEYKIDKKVINVSKHMNAAGGSAVDVLENVPSVNVDIEGNVSLRGSSNFKVLIDGKPTIMDGNDLLKQLPASMIETIEIITNPSAKYDPDGTSGIINIIMKKDSNTGVNGIVNLTAGTNLNPSFKYSGDISLNYRLKKVNYFLSGSYTHEPTNQETSLFTKTYLDSVTKISTSSNDRNFTRGGNNLKAGADFYLNEKNTLSLSAEIGQFIFKREMMATYQFYDEGLITASDFEVVEDQYDILGNYLNANLTYQKKFAKKGHALDLTGVFSIWDGNNIENHLSYATADDWVTEGILPAKSDHKQTNLTNKHKWTLDYTNPITDKSTLEAGLNFETQQAELDFNYWDFDYNTMLWILDSTISNQAKFYRNIYSGYATWSSQVAGFSYKLGLRTEYSNRELEQISLNKKYPLELFKIYPSLSFSKDIARLQTIQLSYSKRVNRPEPWLLNPYTNYKDKLIVSTGNAELEPEYIHSYEANYIRRFETGSFLSAGLYYRQTDNAMTQSMRVVDSFIYVKMDNLNATKAFGLEVSGNLNINKWWSVYAGSNLYMYNVDGVIGADAIDTTLASYTLNANNTFRLGKNTRIQLNIYYNGPTIALQGVQNGFITGGFSIRQDIWKNKASITLNARDPLGMFKYKLIIDNNSYYTDFRMNTESVFKLSFSYKINNYQRRAVKEEPMDMQGGGGVM